MPLPRRPAGPPIAWLVLLALAVLLWIPEAGTLIYSWGAEESASHGPLVAPIAAWMLWTQRARLRRWNATCVPGACLLACSALVYVATVWADIEFARPLALIMMAVGGVWFLGGPSNLVACTGALGFLVFMIPWPTTLVERISFPLQMMSATYAGLLAGLLGVPIHREGVNLYVVPDLYHAPTYSIVVAQACSGLNSLTVLLALSYLIAYFTPVRTGWKLLLIATVVPLTLLTNAVRLTLVLLAGASHHREMATWIHDHEGPVLVFLCSLGLTALRHAILIWTQTDVDAAKDLAPANAPSDDEPSPVA